jgi:hypothetical protein
VGTVTLSPHWDRGDCPPGWGAARYDACHAARMLYPLREERPAG